MWIVALARAAEWCNGADDDGDGLADEGPVLVAPDEDGDGHGDERAASLVFACGEERATVEDCDDDDPYVSPVAMEYCSSQDDDCDGLIDEVGCYGDVSVIERRVWFVSDDETQWLSVEGSCAKIGSEAASIADESDQDTVQSLIGAVASGEDGPWLGLHDLFYEGFWVWSDGNGLTYAAWGDGEPSGNGDCVQMQANGAWDDEPCDEERPWICEAVCSSQSWWADDDGDGLGDPNTLTEGCEAPVGTVANALDCDDADARWPALMYRDEDTDGYGETYLGIGCDRSTAPQGGDCDDGRFASNPGADEVCNAIDDDCDGLVDEGPGGPWYTDRDGDGHGGSEVAGQGLCPPAGTSASSDDCDDSDPQTYPGAPDPEGDGVDADCSGADGPPPDTDGDGARDPSDPAPVDAGGVFVEAPVPPFGCAVGSPTPGLAVIALALATARRGRRWGGSAGRTRTSGGSPRSPR